MTTNGGQFGDLARPTDTCAWHKPPWSTSTLQDDHGPTSKLNEESQALLYAISELLTKHEKQLKSALQMHESQIIQAMDDMSLSSLSRVENLQSKNVKPDGWSQVSVVPLPNCTDEDSKVTAPSQQAVELTPLEEICMTSSFIQDSDENDNSDGGEDNLAQNASKKDLVPEYMQEHGASLKNPKKLGLKRSTVDLAHVFRWQSRVQFLLASKKAEAFVTAIILLNAINIGVQADWAMQNVGKDTPVLFQVANTFFSSMFTIELLLRIYAFRIRFFSWYNREFTWNMFDSFLVVSGLVDEALSLLISTPNFTVIRMLRVFRLVRVIRVVRVLRFFRDLRIIVAGIAGAMKSMLWAVGLLFIIMFIVAICLMQLTAFDLDEMEPEQRDTLLEHYGSLIQAIYTLYLSITGGCDWGDAAQPLLDISPFFGVLYALYIAFAVLCVLNIITGVFVDNASSISLADEEQLVVEGLENRLKWFEEVKKLFTTLVGEQGSLDSRHFLRFLDDVKVQACFHRLGIDVYETSKTGLFQLLDFDGTGKVELEEFAVGLQMLHGDAKKIDLARIQWELHKIKKDLQNICGHIKVDSHSAPGARKAGSRSGQFGSLQMRTSATSDLTNSAWTS